MVAVPEELDRGFEEAYRDHYPALRRRARRWLPADEIEDAVQETFLRAWSHHHGQDPGMGWLVTVLRNLAIDRSRRRSAEPVGDLQALDSPSEEGPDDTVVALEERRAVRRAMLDLTDGQRKVIHLREWSGYSHQEIADSLGTTIPSVESLLLRGRRRLRGALEKVMGLVLWPANSAWKRLRQLPEAGTAAAQTAPVATGQLSAAVAHLATAAVVIVAGVGGGNGGGGGAADEPPAPVSGYSAASTSAGAESSATSRLVTARNDGAGGTTATSSSSPVAGGGSTDTSTSSSTSPAPADTEPISTDDRKTPPPSDTSVGSPDAPNSNADVKQPAPGDGTSASPGGDPETPSSGPSIETSGAAVSPGV